MKKFIAFLVLCSVTQLCSASIGLSSDYILTLTITNHSSQTLNFTGVSGENVGNNFVVTPTQLIPGQQAVLTGTTTPYTDLAAAINFTDSAGSSEVLVILDPRQIRSSEGLFAMGSPEITSFNNKIISKSTNPRSLLYNNVIVVLQDKVTAGDKKIRG